MTQKVYGYKLNNGPFLPDKPTFHSDYTTYVMLTADLNCILYNLNTRQIACFVTVPEQQVVQWVEMSLVKKA